MVYIQIGLKSMIPKI